MKAFLTIITCLIVQLLNAQGVNFVFGKSIGGAGDDRTSGSIAVDSAGNILTIGYFNGTSDFDPGSGIYNLTSIGGFYNVYICKLDATGNFVWAKIIGGTADDFGYSVTVDEAGNVYTVGRFSGTADFDPGTGVYNLISSGTGDVFVSKLSPNGTFMWAKKMGGSGGLAEGHSIAVDSFNNVYTTGYFEGSADFNPGTGVFNLTNVSTLRDIFVSKLDSSGNFVWARQLGGGGTNNYGNSIAVDALGNVYTTGYFESTGDFDPGPGTYNLSGIIFISKLDSSGNFVWAKSFVSSYISSGNAIKVDLANNVYIGGNITGTTDFDPGAGVYNISSAGFFSVAFVAKLDSFGNFVWAKAFTGSSNGSALSIDVDSAENVYTTGYYTGTADFDPGVGTYNITSSGGIDVFISKLDAFGDFVWAISFGSAWDDFAKSDVNNNGTICTNGEYNFTLDADPGGSTYNLTSVGTSSDCFVIKLSQKPDQPSSIVGEAGLCPGSSFTYYVSPVYGATSYTWTLPIGWSGSSTTNSITVTAGSSSGTITVVANNSYGSSSAQTLVVSGSLIVTVNSPAICEGQTANLLAGGATTYSWSGGITSVVDTANVSPTTSTSYIVIGTMGTCSDTAIAVVTVNVIPVTPTITYGVGSVTSSSPVDNQWYLNGVLIPGATNQIYFYGTTNGTYTCVVTTNGCSSAISNSINVGIEDVSNQYGLNIYPNPNDGNFNILFNANVVGDYIVELTNALGQLIYKEELKNYSGAYRKPFSVVEYGKGVYTITLTNDKHDTAKKIIVY